MSKKKDLGLVLELGMMSPAQLTPAKLAGVVHSVVDDRAATAMASSTDILNRDFPGTHAVGKGDPDNPPAVGMIIPKERTKVVLLGKGICMDTGGHDLKPSMHGMKFDMLGAATVLETYKRLPKKVKKHTAVIITCANNVISPVAQKPGDYITYTNGKVVEVGNTDAEGRLVLADGILYAKENLNPDLIINVATLTGCVAYALGETLAGVFTNLPDKEIRKLLDRSNKNIDIKGFHLPVTEEHMKQNVPKKELRKYFDLSNIALHGCKAGASNAAAFLAHFYGRTKYIHLDIAGCSEKDGLPTGGGLALLEKLVYNYYINS